jgi:hypothetical protein
MTVAELKISIDDKGQVTINGPIDQVPLCYGLLEIAKDVIRNQAAENAKRVQRPALAEVAAFGRQP